MGDKFLRTDEKKDRQGNLTRNQVKASNKSRRGKDLDFSESWPVGRGDEREK